MKEVIPALTTQTLTPAPVKKTRLAQETVLTPLSAVMAQIVLMVAQAPIRLITVQAQKR